MKIPMDDLDNFFLNEQILKLSSKKKLLLLSINLIICIESASTTRLLMRSSVYDRAGAL